MKTIMSKEAFRKEWEAIGQEEASGTEKVHARRDQRIAHLFNECGWTQEEIAGEVGKTHQWVSLRLRLGRFLVFSTTGCKSQFPSETLTERRFRGCWARTKGSERERFEQVVKLLADDVPVGYRNLSAKPGYKKAVIEVCQEGGWHNVKQIATILDERFPGITSHQVSAVMAYLQKKPPKGFALIARHEGHIHQYRLVPRADIGTDGSGLADEIRPFLKDIRKELLKSQAAMSTQFIIERVAQIEKVLARLPEAAGVA